MLRVALALAAMLAIVVACGDGTSPRDEEPSETVLGGQDVSGGETSPRDKEMSGTVLRALGASGVGTSSQDEEPSETVLGELAASGELGIIENYALCLLEEAGITEGSRYSYSLPVGGIQSDPFYKRVLNDYVSANSELRIVLQRLMESAVMQCRLLAGIDYGVRNY